MNIRPFEHHHPRIGANVLIDSTALVIGDVEIGADCSIWPLCVVRGDSNAIRIGARTNIQDGTVVHVTHDGPYTPGGYATTIGDEVSIGHKAIIHACSVGERCLIGMGAIIMDGAVIGAESIVGAGAVVPSGRVLQGGHLYVGSPARQVRALSDREREFLAYSAANYVRLKNRYLAMA